MKTALYSALFAFVLALTAAVLVVGYDLHRDLASARGVLDRSAVAVSQLQGTLARVNGTLGTLDQAAAEERSNWNATSKEAAKTGAALRTLIDRVDRSLVDGTLYHINAQTLPAIDAQVASNGDELRATMHKLGETADGLTAATGTLNAQLGDPAIAALLAHSSVTAANLETVSSNAARITGDLARIADDATAPQPWYKRAWGYIWAPVKITAVFLK